MTNLRNLTFGTFLVMILSFGLLNPAQGQPANPEVLDNGTLQEQFDYVHNRTRIYEGFRAIRDDMFQKVRRNSLDSLNKAKQETQSYIALLEETRQNMDALEARLDQTIAERDQAIDEKDSIFLLGIPVNKTFYNILLWSIIGGLAALVVVVFLLFNRSNRITRNTNREMADLQVEYDEYRKNSRERFEKQSIDHFNELRKLKGV